jgi:hypothetical protein
MGDRWRLLGLLLAAAAFAAPAWAQQEALATDEVAVFQLSKPRALAPSRDATRKKQKSATRSVARRANVTVPANWVCSSSFFSAGDGCDCSCGVTDPDCTDPTATIFGCDAADKVAVGCAANGTCVYVNQAAVPPTWTECSSSFYGTNDGCDCACGAPDPDCLTDPSNVFGCPGNITCLPSGVCNVPPPPESWRCGAGTYGTGDGCDCGLCGARDPDCDDSTQAVFFCPCAGMTCDAAGFCAGLCAADADYASAVQRVTGPPASSTIVSDSESGDGASGSLDGVAVLGLIAFVLVVLQCFVLVGAAVFYKNYLHGGA